MTRSNSSWLRVAAALLVLGATATGLGFTLMINDTTQLPIKWPAGAVKLRIKLGDTKVLGDGRTYNAVAQSAATTWNAVIGSLQFETELLPAGPAAQQLGGPSPQSPQNELVFAADVFGRSFGDALAVTTSAVRGNERGEADVIFNSAYQWDSYLGPTRFTDQQLVVDLRRVALHELGHVLGLGHSDAAGQVNPPASIMTTRAGDLYILTDDDIAGARCLYGPPGVPANDNFANAFPLIMAGNRTLSTSHFNTNATKEAGDPRQGDNPGGRSVWWRWIAPSAGTVTIDTKGSYFDTTLGVYTGATLASLVKVADNDDIDPGVRQNSSLTFTTIAGTEYRIDVDGFNPIEELASITSGADNAAVTLNLKFEGDLGTAPTITSQPVNATVTDGSSSSFSVTVSGSAPLNYQWYQDGTAIAGATGSNLSIPFASKFQAGTYTVTVTNAAGIVTSNGAVLTVNPAPVVTVPQSGGGGGGGAPSLWFCLLLVVLGVGRRLRNY